MHYELTLRLAIACAAAIAAGDATLGCTKASGQDFVGSTRFAKIEDLQPYVEPYPRAYILTGSPVETEVDTKTSLGSVRFRFLLHGESIDEEYYDYSDKVFRYVGNLDEAYVPGIPLVKFPLETGEGWTWSGTQKWGNEDRRAKADVKTELETLKTAAGEYKTVKVKVQLSVESGLNKPHTRNLTFWIAPKRGVVRREFEYSTTREPMPPKDDDGGS